MLFAVTLRVRQRRRVVNALEGRFSSIAAE